VKDERRLPHDANESGVSVVGKQRWLFLWYKAGDVGVRDVPWPKRRQRGAMMASPGFTAGIKFCRPEAVRSRYAGTITYLRYLVFL
jgi:hypothetical protein